VNKPVSPQIKAAIDALPDVGLDIDNNFLSGILGRRGMASEIIGSLVAMKEWDALDQVLFGALRDLVEKDVPAMLREIAASRSATHI